MDLDANPRTPDPVTDAADWPIGVVRADASGRVFEVNPAAESLLARLGGADPEDLFDPRSAMTCDFTRTALHGLMPGETRRRRLRGAGDLCASLTVVRERDGGLTALIVDDSAALGAETEAHRQRSRFAAVADAAWGAAVYALDRGGRVSAWSRSAERLERLTAGEAVGMPFESILERAAFPADAFALMAAAARDDEASTSGFGWARAGRARWARLTVRAVRAADGALDGFVAIVADAPPEPDEKTDLRRLAALDQLTGLLNRRAFFETAEPLHRRLSQSGRSVAVIVFDIDRFKTLNDGHGHQAGDAALTALGDVARAETRDADVLGRLGGDEFAIVLPRADLARAAAVAERLRAALAAARPSVGGQVLAFTASFGVAEGGRPDETLTEVLARADAALYAAKAAGRDRVAEA